MKSIDFGDVRFRALATPGHTPGSVCYLMEQAGLRALFAGDVISDAARPRGSARTGWASRWAPTRPTCAPRYRGNAGDYLASLRRLRALPVPDLVLARPPAAPTRHRRARPCRNSAGNALLDDGHPRDGNPRGPLSRPTVADFLDGDPKALLPDLYYLGDFGGTAVYGFFAASKFFLAGAGGQPGLVAFVKARLRQLGREPVDPDGGPAHLGRTGRASRPEGDRREMPGPGGGCAGGHRGLKHGCPTGTVFLPAAELPAQGWFKVTPIPLRRRGFGPMAYLLEWAGKTVLLTGRMPIKVTPQSVAGLPADIGESKADWQDYQASLAVLGSIRPDLWLPATPVDGQNANLYGDEWQAVIGGNGNIARFMLSRVKLTSDYVKESEQDSK